LPAWIDLRRSNGLLDGTTTSWRLTRPACGVGCVTAAADEQEDKAGSGEVDERGKVDEKTDGIIIIDSAGTMLLVNKTAYRLFGYERGELEGKNISMMMPSPFSERHNGYLKNYIMTGVAKILNQDRQVVCLRKVGL
jgi:PAS domain-containing protein